jgi:DNA helicase-2/ATP-dependent DNA helicase PcrA
MSELRDLPEDRDVAEILESILQRSGYMEALEAERSIEAQGRIENLEELISVAREFDLNRGLEGASDIPPLEEFLQQISLYTEQDKLIEQQELLTLMTLHNAKGLEFDAVFIVGCEDGVFPHSRALDEGQEEEERRLCYVGMTRARKRLYLTSARSRGPRGGFTEVNGPSRFIDEIPDDLVERQGSAPGIATVRSYRAPGSGFSPVTAAPRATEPVAVAVGDDVVHASFGEGVVIGSEPGGVIVIRFAADGSERKLMAEYAPITRR